MPLSKRFPALLFVIAACALLTSSLAWGQAKDQTWDGGDNTWDTGTTHDWDSTTPPNVWTGGDDYAQFFSTPGKVSVDDSTAGGPVTTDGLEFSAPTGNYIIKGDPLDIYSGSGNNIVQLDGNDLASVEINSDIDIASQKNNDRLQNYSSEDLTVNNMTITGTASGFDEFHVDSYGTGEIILNGMITPGVGGGKLMFGEYGGSSSAVYQVNGNVSNLTNGLETASGVVLLGPNINLGNNGFDAFGPSTGESGFLTNGAMTVSAGFAVNYGGYGVYGGNSADISTFSGSASVFDDSHLTVTAATGGRVNFTGNLGGEIPNGLIKTGNGIVVLGSSTGNSYVVGGSNNNTTAYTPGTVAADLQAGTTLITNTSGSAFGTSGFGSSNSPNATVNVEAGATLGGTGISTQTVVASGSTTVIAPGDPGQSNLIPPSIGTLHLNGGLSAENGLTVDFKLDGAVSNPFDTIDLGGSTLTSGPGSTLTFNFTNLGGALSTDTDYAIMTGIGADDTDPSTNFVFNAPAGYTVVDPSLNDDDSAPYGTLTVEFEAVPEPSTYLLMGLGGMILVGLARRKHAIF